MNKIVVLLFGFTSMTAAASDTALRQCRAVADDRARLACYDAIPTARVSSSSTTPTAGSQAAPAAAFGMPAPDNSKDEVTSRIVGPFEGWDSETVLRLENGQYWRVVDGSRAAYWLDSPRVRIGRGTFSGYVMTIEGVAQNPRVRRVK